MILKFNVLVLFSWMLTLAMPQSVEYQPCPGVAVEEEPYSVEYSDVNSQGTYFWYLKPKKGEVVVLSCGEDGQPDCDSRISARLFENYSESQNYARTRIVFRQVSVDERDAVIRCVNSYSFGAFEKEVFSCRMRVHAKPLTTICQPSSLSLRCTAQRVFPAIACVLYMTETSLKTKRTITDFKYSSLTYLRGGAEYRNASCDAEFQTLQPGTYLAMVSVNVQSAGPADKTYMTSVYVRSFNFTVPKTAVSLTQATMGKCLENNKGTTAVQLKCEAEGYSSKPQLIWQWNERRIGDRNRPIELLWSDGKISSTFKFQPVRADSGAIVNCTVISDTKSASAIFKIPAYPDLPPKFINASDGQLILSQGSEQISCQTPGSGSGFLKVNMSCSANGTYSFRQVSPGNVSHMNLRNALLLDQALCRCGAVHNFFCYSLIAEVQVRVKTNPQITEVVTLHDLGTSPQYIGNCMVYVLSITCPVLLLLIIAIAILIKYKRRKKKRSQISNEHPHCWSGDHIYEDPDVVQGVDPNAATHSLMSKPARRPDHIRTDSLGYLEPKPSIPRLPDIVSEFNNGRRSTQQTTKNSVIRNKSENSKGSIIGIAETMSSESLLGGLYINRTDAGRYSKTCRESQNSKTTHIKHSCIPDKSKSLCNEMYISPLDTLSSSETSLPFHSNASPKSKSNSKSLTIDNYNTLESSNFDISEKKPNSEQFENPKSPTFFSRPLENLEIKKKETFESDSFKVAKSQTIITWVLNGATKSRKSSGKNVLRSSKGISRKTSTRETNYL